MYYNREPQESSTDKFLTKILQCLAPKPVRNGVNQLSRAVL